MVVRLLFCALSGKLPASFLFGCVVPAPLRQNRMKREQRTGRCSIKLKENCAGYHILRSSSYDCVQAVEVTPCRPQAGSGRLFSLCLFSRAFTEERARSVHAGREELKLGGSPFPLASDEPACFSGAAFILLWRTFSYAPQAPAARQEFPRPRASGPPPRS